MVRNIQNVDMRLGGDDFKNYFGKTEDKKATAGKVSNTKLKPAHAKLKAAWESLKITFHHIAHRIQTGESVTNKQIHKLNESIKNLIEQANEDEKISLGAQELNEDITILNDAIKQAKLIIEKLKEAKADKTQMMKVDSNLRHLSVALNAFENKDPARESSKKALEKRAIQPRSASTTQIVQDPKKEALSPIEVKTPKPTPQQIITQTPTQPSSERSLRKGPSIPTSPPSVRTSQGELKTLKYNEEKPVEATHSHAKPDAQKPRESAGAGRPAEKESVGREHREVETSKTETPKVEVKRPNKPLDPEIMLQAKFIKDAIGTLLKEDDDPEFRTPRLSDEENKKFSAYLQNNEPTSKETAEVRNLINHRIGDFNHSLNKFVNDELKAAKAQTVQSAPVTKQDTPKVEVKRHDKDHEKDEGSISREMKHLPGRTKEVRRGEKVTSRKLHKVPEGREFETTKQKWESLESIDNRDFEKEAPKAKGKGIGRSLYDAGKGVGASVRNKAGAGASYVGSKVSQVAGKAAGQVSGAMGRFYNLIDSAFPDVDFGEPVAKEPPVTIHTKETEGGAKAQNAQNVEQQPEKPAEVVIKLADVKELEITAPEVIKDAKEFFGENAELTVQQTGAHEITLTLPAVGEEDGTPITISMDPHVEHEPEKITREERELRHAGYAVSGALGNVFRPRALMKIIVGGAMAYNFSTLLASAPEKVKTIVEQATVRLPPDPTDEGATLALNLFAALLLTTGLAAGASHILTKREERITREKQERAEVRLKQFNTHLSTTRETLSGLENSGDFETEKLKEFERLQKEFSDKLEKIQREGGKNFQRDIGGLIADIEFEINKIIPDNLRRQVVVDISHLKKK